MFEFEACEVLKTKEFTIVNDCFQNEHNEKIGHYGQTLYNSNIISNFCNRQIASFAKKSKTLEYYTAQSQLRKGFTHHPHRHAELVSASSKFPIP